MLAVHEKCTIFAPSIIKNRSHPCLCQKVLLNLHRCSHCAAARHRRRKRSSSSVISESRQLTGMTGQAKDALPLDVYVPLCTIPPQGVSDFTLIGHAGSREPTNAISKSRLTLFYVQMFPHPVPPGTAAGKQRNRNIWK